MLSIYLCTLLICAASLVAGRAILALLGRPRPPLLAGATGFAALVIVAPLLLRLPGRATTAAIVLALALVVAAWIAWRDLDREAEAREWAVGALAALTAVAVASIPFLVSDRVGVLGEGVYTNDHAAQLYWTDWLQHGFGPEPSAVRFGYPVGPQAVAAITATATGASLVSAFNGLLIAIPVLTALTALGGLTMMPAGRRVAIAALSALPYLAASFYAQSAFKETAMALFVLAFALALATRDGEEGDRREPLPWLPVLGVGAILALATVFTFSVPGLAWFALALPLWLAFEGLAGRSPVDWSDARGWIISHRLILGGGALLVVIAAALAFSPAREFASKIADVQESAGRLSSPVFPGEALGIWPQGDFRIVRGEVSGSLVAVAIGALAVAYGAWVLLRRRQLALLAMLVAGGAVYVGARLAAEIHVEAKALAIIAPLVMLIALRALLAPGNPIRVALGTIVFVAAAGSTLLALRDAPIGFDERQVALEQLAERADGAPVAFLGVDRFAGYYLRGTLARAPAGYVPEEVSAREDKRWVQGDAADFDSLDSGQLDKFRYAITTSAAYQSSPPPNFVQVESAGDYVLWRRQGETPRGKVLPEEAGNPGAVLDCADRRPRRDGEAVVLAEPVLVEYSEWETPAPPAARVAGQERGWQAPGEATTTLDLPRGDYALSLQYHSQVPLKLSIDDRPLGELPASVEGMYLSGAGRGAFWPAGEFASDGGPHQLQVVAEAPSGLADALDARRLVWLGDVAATPDGDPQTVPLRAACGAYVDRYAYDRKGGG